MSTPSQSSTLRALANVPDAELDARIGNQVRRVDLLTALLAEAESQLRTLKAEGALRDMNLRDDPSFCEIVGLPRRTVEM